MRRKTKRRAVEAGGCWLRATSRWTAICSRRGGGEQVQMIENFNYEGLRMGDRRKEEVNEESRQMVEIGGEGGLF